MTDFQIWENIIRSILTSGKNQNINTIQFRLKYEINQINFLIHLSYLAINTEQPIQVHRVNRPRMHTSINMPREYFLLFVHCFFFLSVIFFFSISCVKKASNKAKKKRTLIRKDLKRLTDLIRYWKNPFLIRRLWLKWFIVHLDCKAQNQPLRPFNN